MSEPSKSCAGPIPSVVLALLILVILVLGAGAGATRGSPTLGSQSTFTNNDPSGQGVSTLTVFYELPQHVQVGDNLTVPIELRVDNLTGAMAYLQDYNLSIALALSDGRHISGQVGVTPKEAASNASALQLRAGEVWGILNLTVPLTPATTGLSQGREVLGNATLSVRADVWFDSPVNAAKPEEDQSPIGYLLIQDGTPAGPQPNFVGFALVAAGAILLATSLVVSRRRKPKKVDIGPDTESPPGTEGDEGGGGGGGGSSSGQKNRKRPPGAV
jgi:hypothetical protein